MVKSNLYPIKFHLIEFVVFSSTITFHNSFIRLAISFISQNHFRSFVSFSAYSHIQSKCFETYHNRVIRSILCYRYNDIEKAVSTNNRLQLAEYQIFCSRSEQLSNHRYRPFQPLNMKSDAPILKTPFNKS